MYAYSYPPPTPLLTLPLRTGLAGGGFLFVLLILALVEKQFAKDTMETTKYSPPLQKGMGGVGQKEALTHECNYNESKSYDTDKHTSPPLKTLGF